MAAPEVKIRPVQDGDALVLYCNMRQEEIDEISASHGDVKKAILDSISVSEECWSMVIDGQLIAIWGVVRSPYGLGCLSDGVCWMVPTKTVGRYKKTFWRECKRVIPDMVKRWGILTNAIDCRHTRAIEWGRRLGFKFASPTSFGVEGRDFMMYSIGG
jgi:hypothetical protein